MPEWLKTIVYVLAGVGFWTVSASIALWLRDRSGKSGRETHWTSNPRILQPGELSDEDHEAYGAMIHAMRPREDLRDE
jgi:hypothetical protein